MTPLLLALALGSAPRESIGFEAAVAQALERSPALAVARQDVARAHAQLEQARAPSLPTLSGAATLQQLEGDRPTTGVVVQPRQQATGNLLVSVPVVGGPRWGQWVRASRAEDAVRAGADDVRRQVALLAARSWLQVLGQKRVVAAAQTARDTAARHLEYARARMQGGVGNRLDELRAAQELSTTLAQLEGTLGNLVRLEEALGVAVGAEEPLDVPEVEPRLAVPAEDGQALHEGVDARQDVVAARAREAAARAGTQVDWLDYLPLVTAAFQPFFQVPATPTLPNLGWQAQLVLALPLYDGSLRYGQAHERAALSASATAQVEQAVRQARSEVRAAFEQVQHADRAALAARAAAAEAQEALELATLAWRTGVSTNLEVIDAERRARDALVQSALADDAARQARLDLLAGAGRFP
jgi:outer membrane protein